MKKWAIPLAAAGVLAVVAVAGAAFALNDSGDESGPGVSRDADDSGESGGDSGESGGDGTGSDVAGICLEGAIDCDDTIDTPVDPGVCIQIFPTPPECVDPDTPVSDDPPPSDEPPASDVCIDTFPAPPECIAGCTLEYPNECSGKAAALADLAARLDIADDAITVISAERVDWPDTCLGISQPDVPCAEVITYGYRIVLEANGQMYEYHTDGGSRAVLAD
jgi:hypothetical protein